MAAILTAMVTASAARPTRDEDEGRRSPRLDKARLTLDGLTMLAAQSTGSPERLASIMRQLEETEATIEALTEKVEGARE